jgi:TolB-like protein
MSASGPISLGASTTVGNAWLDRRAGAVLTPLSIRSSAVDLSQHHRTDQRTTEGRFRQSEHASIIMAEGTSELPFSNAGVLQQLTGILQSKAFIQSEKLSRFLRFVVEHALEGNPGCLKEYLIGVEVYDRKPPYDPSQDSIVRTEARRLRSKLKEYYEADGKQDQIYIYLRPGSYVPVFQSREDLIGAASIAESEVFLLPKSASIVTAVLPFRDISENPISSTYARGIPDELAYVLMMTYGCTVLPPLRLANLCPQEQDFAQLMKKVGAHIAFEGSVRVEGLHLRITARIVDATGVQLWVKRIDAEGGTEFSFAIEEQIVSALSAGLDAVRTPGLRLPRRSSPA